VLPQVGVVADGAGVPAFIDKIRPRLRIILE
jgi:hypothetical protein